MTSDSFVTGVDFVSVPTEDLDRAAEFYEPSSGWSPAPAGSVPGTLP